MIERTEFVKTLPRDLVIHINKSQVKIFLCLLPPESRFLKKINDNKLEIQTDINMSFDESFLLDMLLGRDSDSVIEKDPNLLLDAYLFFSALEMRSHELVVLKKVLRVANLENLVNLFIRSYKALEKRRDVNFDDLSLDSVTEASSVSFDSTFTLNLFNVLSTRVEEIRKASQYLKIFELLNVWSSLIVFTPVPIESMSRYQNIKEESFSDLFREQCKEMYQIRTRTSNLIIVSSDEKELLAHKEIIIAKSDYFYKVFKFGGLETRREGYLILENLDFGELEVMLEFIYTGEITRVKKPEFILTLAKILEEIVPYDEHALKMEVKKKILEISKDQIEKGKFLEDGLLRIGYLFSETNPKLPEELRNEFFQVWGATLKESELGATVGKSEVLKIAEDYEKEKTEMEESLSSRVDSMEKRIDMIENDVKEMNSSMVEMKGSISEILDILKESNQVPRRRSKRKRGTGKDEEKEPKTRKKNE